MAAVTRRLSTQVAHAHSERRSGSVSDEVHLAWNRPNLYLQRNAMNVFMKIGLKVADFGKWFARIVTSIVGLAVRIEKVLQSEKPLEQPFISSLSTVVSDVETLIAASQGALSAEGLNVSADSKVYSSLVTLIDDFGKLASVVEEALAILEGKQTATAAVATK